MTPSRLDLDGVGSPAGLVTRILQLTPDLPLPVPIEELARQFDINSIGTLQTKGFEAALVTDRLKSQGAILVSASASRSRRRFSIAHELGHFLIPTHMVTDSGLLQCTRADLARKNHKASDPRLRMEAEANRFAALLLMPPPILRRELARSRPDLNELVRLASLFDVSKEAMARAYVEYHREDIAILIVRDCRLARVITSTLGFAWINAGIGGLVPDQSVWHDRGSSQGRCEPPTLCEPDIWIGQAHCNQVEALTEQVLVQANGFSMILLHAELSDPDEDDEVARRR